MKRMLFNATHAEELRVAIVDGQKLIDIDIESAGREQRKSNIYKGIVTRIEPSLEACFVNYGEDRHGFLPFKEISKQYFKDGSDVGKARIQDVLSEGQELLVQVEKEERGNKGAALTTFISLAGRYLVLMPNNPRGGGVSRRIEGEDRQELREALDKLDYPKGMSIIARTAGIGRSVEELQWDLNYLLQLWSAIDSAGKSANGAFLIYQESSLVIRAIRDYFHPDIGEVLIDTDDIYDQAKQFMQHVMPDMMKVVKRYRDDIPLFSRFQIEHQIETAYSRMVPLPSGGAIVIDHTEALVSIDVNSARATRGSDIEDTALRTNVEAAEEVARQLRLRDLGGLIVIDFIDMERAQNQKEVEQRVKDSLRLDRARVQMGKISRFGLMELSRQRIRPALNEGSHTTCPRCNGTGVIRDTESSALHVLRIIQEEAMKEGTASVRTQVPVDVATFLLNEKRAEIHKLEARLKVSILLIPNKYLETPHYEVTRLRHDDEKLDETAASFELVTVASEQSYYEKKISSEATKRQEAVIKGVIPAQPAPPATPKPSKKETVATDAKPSFFAKIMAWFKRAEPVAQPPAIENKPTRKESADKDSRGGRGNRNNRRRGNVRKEDQTNSAANGESKQARESSENRRGSQRGQGRRAQENEQTTEREENKNLQQGASKVVDAANAEAQDDAQKANQSRNRRRRRGRRGGGQSEGTDGQELNAAANEDRNTEQSADTSANDENGSDDLADRIAQTVAYGTESGPNASEDQEGRGPRRRRRRRRGGAGSGTEEQADAVTQESPEAEPVTSTVMSSATTEDTVNPEAEKGAMTAEPSEATTEVVNPVEPVAEATKVDDAKDAEPSANVVQAAESSAEAQPSTQDEPVAVAEPLQQAEVAAAEIVASESPSEVASNESGPNPAIAPQADVSPQAVKAEAESTMDSNSTSGLNKDGLNSMLEKAGMLWIETDREKWTVVQERLATETKPARIPRERKPVPKIDSGNLILVETREEFRQ